MAESNQQPMPRLAGVRFRFSLKALLGATAFVAVGCAALSLASDLWSRALLTMMLLRAATEPR